MGVIGSYWELLEVIGSFRELKRVMRVIRVIGTFESYLGVLRVIWELLVICTRVKILKYPLGPI